jgi:hypothetical protein
MRTCKEVHRLVAESMDRRVGLVERIAMHAHLAICVHCRKFTRQMQFLRAALRRFPGDESVPQHPGD